MENSIVKIEFTDEQVNLIKTQIAPKANDNELKLFLYQCKRTGLDPLARQIYCIPIGGRMTIQTSIDGFRVVAERSGTYAGQDEPVWDEDETGIKKCTVKVYRFSNGVRYCAGVGVAHWKEYAQSSPMWAKMPHTMIAKCAEALALRKSFPQDLSGLYTSDEMQQAQPVSTDIEIDNIPTKEERQLLKSLVYGSTFDEEKRMAAFEAIDTCMDYKKFQLIQHRLEANQKTLEHIENPTPTDINKHVKKLSKVPVE